MIEQGHDHDHENDPDHEHDHEDGAELEIDTQSQIFLEMRQQNMELLQIAAKIGGYGGDHGPLKPGDVKHALKNLWEIYSELYSWVDPEESEGDDDEDDEEE